MKQTLNKWLKINQTLKLNLGKFNIVKFKTFKQLFLKQNCLLCSANIDTDFVKNFYREPRAASKSADNKSAGSQLIDNQLVGSKSNYYEALCEACFKSLPWQNVNHCPQCGLASNAIICGSCINSAPHFDVTHAVFQYAFPIDVMIQRYKYGNLLSLSTLFGQLLNDKIQQENIDLIIPMPMHPQRLKLRGFNQALEIARVLSASQPPKLDYKSVVRQTLTPPQASLRLSERVKNIKGAFRVNNDFTGKKIAIVDDVMTTGASLDELAKTLKKAGASHVECWVIARTLPHN